MHFQLLLVIYHVHLLCIIISWYRLISFSIFLKSSEKFNICCLRNNINVFTISLKLCFVTIFDSSPSSIHSLPLIIIVYQYILTFCL